MFIVAQNRTVVINVDNLISVEVTENRIFAMLNRDDYLIGVYQSEERAAEVFEEILKTVFQPLIIMKNCGPHENLEKMIETFRTDKVLIVENNTEKASVEIVNNGVYYMPED